MSNFYFLQRSFLNSFILSTFIRLLCLFRFIYSFSYIFLYFFLVFLPFNTFVWFSSPPSMPYYAMYTISKCKRRKRTLCAHKRIWDWKEIENQKREEPTKQMIWRQWSYRISMSMSLCLTYNFGNDLKK